jgi:glycosyltransferase involved in cell wall biosynthesis
MGLMGLNQDNQDTFINEYVSSDIQEGNALDISKRKLSIIIPAYNEERRIGKTIQELAENIPNIEEILVVFDGSDNTPNVALGSSTKVKVMQYNTRLGQGGAVLEGFRYASGDIVCFIDADGSAPWYEVKRVCSLVSDKNPVVYGSRWAQGAKIGKKEPLRNIIGGRVYHYLAFAILGVNIKDSFCGLKAFDKEIIQKLLKKVTIKDRTFNIAISYNLKLMNIKPLEIGIEWSHKDGTQLRVGIKVILLMFLTLIGLRIAHSQRLNGFNKFILKFRKKINFY